MIKPKPKSSSSQVKYNKAERRQKLDDLLDTSGIENESRKPMEKVISIKFPTGMLNRIDARAQKSCIARAAWIRMELNKTLDELDRIEE